MRVMGQNTPCKKINFLIIHHFPSRNNDFRARKL